MSSTWSFAKQVAALRAPTGTPFYLLSESTCDSNVFPRKASFSNVFFGTHADAMRHIVKTSCYAEGGCLKAGNGRPTTPEKQIGTWREAMKAPVPLQYGEVTLAFGDGFYGVAVKHRHEAFELLMPLGAKEIKGNLVFMLDAPMVCETLAGLIKRHQFDGFATWRVFPHHQYPRGLAAPDLAHKPRKARSNTPLGVTLFRGARPGQMGDRFVFMVEDDGTAQLSHDWSLVQTYTGTHVSELEALEPGTAESRIGEFREALANAPGIPDALEVRVSVRENQQTWLNQQFERLCKEASATATDSEVVLTGAQLETTNTLYLLQSFERNQTRVTNAPAPEQPALRETASLF